MFPSSRSSFPPGRPPRSFVWLAALIVVSSYAGLTTVGAVAQPRSDIPTQAPSDAPSKLRVTGEEEPGEPLVVHGRVLGPDGEPLPDASVFVYQTGEDGIYGPEGNRNPRLRGYLRTDDEGRFEIRTIKPGSYPGSSIAAHIHIHVAPPDGEPEQVGEIVFEGDPLLSERMRRNPFFTVVELEKGEDGVLEASYRMQLEQL